MSNVKKMPTGIRQKGDKYYARCFVGRDEYGKPKYVEKAFLTIREAKTFRAEMMLQKRDGAVVTNNKETLETFCKTFLTEKARQVREGTLRKYRSDINKHIIPLLGKKELQKLTPADFKSMYRRLEGRISEQSIKHIHVLLKQIMKEACTQRKIAVNPLNDVKPPKPRRVEMSTWTRDEVLTYLKAVRSHRYYMFFSLALATGMRCGEILGLCWRDITFAEDSKSAVINIQRAWTHGIKGYVMVGPKTQRGYRAIDLPEWVIAELIQHRQTQEKERALAGPNWQENDLVICTQIGTPVGSQNIRMLHKKMTRKCGLPYIRIHDFRHTHATLLLSGGTPAHVVQQRLGHEDVSTTLQIYSHVLPTMQREAAQKINSMISPYEKNEKP